MDMTLSKRGDYVMRSAISLARAFEGGESRKIREVVAETEVPRTFASQILADLVRAGLALSRAGRDGGYRLARSPGEISVLEVVEAAEGPLRAERCALGAGPCRWDAVCPLHETWTEATVTLRELLSRTTLAELAERDAAIEAGSYAVPRDAHRSHPVSVPIADAVQVELGATALRGALVDVAGALGALVRAACVDGQLGEAPLARVGRGGALAAEASLAPLGPGAGDEAERYLLAWELTSAAGGSRLEAELAVQAVDAERSEVGVEGTWRQDPHGEGPLLEGPDLERQARSVLRSFLRRLARELEEQPGRPEAPSTPPAGRRAAVRRARPTPA